jgi:hypothetical protein
VKKRKFNFGESPFYALGWIEGSENGRGLQRSLTLSFGKACVSS